MAAWFVRGEDAAAFKNSFSAMETPPPFALVKCWCGLFACASIRALSAALLSSAADRVSLGRPRIAPYRLVSLMQNVRSASVTDGTVLGGFDLLPLLPESELLPLD